MTPVRLVILAVLLYIGWRLIRSLLQDKFSGSDTKGKDEARIQDVLVEDPVCHTLVPKSQAVRLRKNGQTYYFCSEKCCDSFTGKPEGET